MTPFVLYRETCRARLATSLERRPGNALNVEIGQGADRCLDKRPSNWPESMTGIRWLSSGGGPFVFGACSSACPRLCIHDNAETCWWCANEDEAQP